MATAGFMPPCLTTPAPHIQCCVRQAPGISNLLLLVPLASHASGRSNSIDSHYLVNTSQLSSGPLQLPFRFPVDPFQVQGDTLFASVACMELVFLLATKAMGLAFEVTSCQ